MKLRYLLPAACLLIALSCKDTATSNEPESPQPPENSDLVSEDIGPDGGEIISKDGKLTLTIPAGALGNTETITIEPINPDELGPEFDNIETENAWELEPDGLTFDRSITVQFETDQNPTPDDTTLSVAQELLLTSNGETVEPLDSLRVEADADSGTVMVSGELRHFSPLVDDKLLRFGVEFLVFKVPDAVPLGRTFKPIANLLDDSNQITDDPPYYQDFSLQPVKLNGDNPTLPMEEHSTIQNAFTISLGYNCTGPGTGVYDAFTLVRGTSFPDGKVLKVTKEVECVKGGSVEGRVTLNGKGIAEVIIFSDRDDFQETRTDQDGNYLLENVLPGNTRDIFIDPSTLPENAECDETKKTVTVEPGKTTAPVDFECFTEQTQTADLFINFSGPKDPVTVGEEFTVTVEVGNNGPDPAEPEIRFNFNVLDYIAFSDNVECMDPSNGEVECKSEEPLGIDEQISAEFILQATELGSFDLSAEATSGPDGPEDPNQNNNTDNITITAEEENTGATACTEQPLEPEVQFQWGGRVREQDDNGSTDVQATVEISGVAEFVPGTQDADRGTWTKFTPQEGVLDIGTTNGGEEIDFWFDVKSNGTGTATWTFRASDEGGVRGTVTCEFVFE